MIALLATFIKPTTKDFVWSCWGPQIHVAGVPFCMNFIFFLLLLVMVLFIGSFFLAFRKPKVVPGKFQALMEMGLEFVREQIVVQMIGPEGLPFFGLIATFFFMIFFGNILEVIPGINFSPNSRIAFPIVLAVVSWVTFNVVGIRRHGFFGYMKMVLFPPGAPKALYILLTPIEFISTILVRPLTLSVRLFANLVAGHFLLAVFFLGTIALLQSGVLAIAGVFSGVLAIVLVGFEIFVSLLQAFIFSVLSASYIAGAMADEH
ncbi:MAG: F-type H+-transporting ATPase subunit a [Actinomycetota bacterium]|nr:F-type H+-transporting ATPase subunit a [Actinomycetota bacterium]